MAETQPNYDLDYERLHIRAQIATFAAEKMKKDGYPDMAKLKYFEAAQLEEKVFNLSPGQTSQELDWRKHFARNTANLFKKSGFRDEFKRASKLIKTIK